LDYFLPVFGAMPKNLETEGGEMAIFALVWKCPFPVLSVKQFGKRVL